MLQNRQTRTVVAVVVAFALNVLPGSGDEVRWFRFNKAFIEEHFASDSVIGSLEATRFGVASSLHSRRCSGDDGELHIGSDNGDLVVPNACLDLAAAEREMRSTWFGNVAVNSAFSAAIGRAAAGEASVLRRMSTIRIRSKS